MVISSLVGTHSGSKLAILKNRKICSFLLILTLLALTSQCRGNGGGCSYGQIRTINLAWDASPDPGAVGYKVYYGTSPRTYGPGIDVGKVTTFALTGLIKGRKYFIAVKAYDTSRHESDFSNEVTSIAN